MKTGEGLYFYNPNDLEEDLLLMCLGEGNGEDAIFPGKTAGTELASYMDDKAKTGRWITQELWARTVWRIGFQRSPSRTSECYADAFI